MEWYFPTTSPLSELLLWRPYQGKFQQATWAKKYSAQMKEMPTVVWTSLLYCDFLRASKLIKGQLKSRKYAKYLRFAAQLVYRVRYTNSIKITTRT